jgi:hypothetical protein
MWSRIGALVLCGFAMSRYLRMPPRSVPRFEQGLQQTGDNYLRHIASNCSESPSQFRHLVYADTDQLLYLGRDTLTQPGFLNSLRQATEGHDPRRPCAGIVDSVARALARPNKRLERTRP